MRVAAAQGTRRDCPRFARSGPRFARPVSPRAPAPKLSWSCLRRDAMNPATSKPDPNAELRHFEPLRVALALGALLLGLVMGIH
jgi:hypothetical protein